MFLVTMDLLYGELHILVNKGVKIRSLSKKLTADASFRHWLRTSSGEDLRSINYVDRQGASPNVHACLRGGESTCLSSRESAIFS